MEMTAWVVAKGMAQEQSRIGYYVRRYLEPQTSSWKLRTAYRTATKTGWVVFIIRGAGAVGG